MRKKSQVLRSEHLTGYEKPERVFLVRHQAVGEGRVARVAWPFDHAPRHPGYAVEGSAEDVANMVAAEKVAGVTPLVMIAKPALPSMPSARR